MNLIIFSEAREDIIASPSAQDMIDMTRAAQLVGCPTYFIPKDFSECETAENALWYVPTQEEETIGIGLGFIPSPKRYNAIYEAALRRNVRLVNSPDEHLRALEFDRSYPLLEGITPTSEVLTESSTPNQWSDAGARLGFLRTWCGEVSQTGGLEGLRHGGWIIIEVGDAQFAASGQMERLPLWNNICEAVRDNHQNDFGVTE